MFTVYGAKAIVLFERGYELISLFSSVVVARLRRSLEQRCSVASSVVDSRCSRSFSVSGGVARRKSRPWCARAGWPQDPRSGDSSSDVDDNETVQHFDCRLTSYYHPSLSK